ncbi:MAG: 4-(cytidine 5'-diphospho)-2-C-methyl-D-erythritol kinase [Pseudomonadales bacterium]|nr:4-(cytidine 5'-diphospho)-2-C-methyl-D-erythritol kinase [Pseudomonadales bacterium]MCP5330556.1 4-(cytidine 5'-diphospho)-2-C-methyl-D-erythritol kinase [Pseudomonadales bacterium]MCP5344183.1 4-(cytidine 5'-diphospho)-2-C-methyl-D-erythritol kinase [Pseudomonadales bacterium]
MIISCPAKLNLFLHITGRRADGYHLLQTVFQLIDYGDTLHINPRSDDALCFTCSEPALAGEDNLVLRAARALRDATGTRLGADLHLDKRIPAGAGLGGGSSDAASALLGLNRLWQTGLDEDALAAIGLRLGADVPLFVRGRSAWAEGVGEVLIPVDLPPRFFLVITPDCHVSTGEIFSHQELTRDTTAIKMAAFLEGHTRNDCENVVRSLYPPVDEALKWLNQFASARMTGTGASLFAAFDSEQQAIALLNRLPQGMQGFVARSLSERPD